MLEYGFYNSVQGDRRYDSRQMAEIFEGTITDGVYPSVGEMFATTPGVGLQVLVGTGRAWFESTWSRNKAKIPVDLDIPDPVFERIDTICLKVDKSTAARANSIAVVKGPISTNPSPAVLPTDDEIFYHPLSYVHILPAATSITAAQIDILVGSSLCPFVTSILQQTNIDVLFANWTQQFMDWWDNIKTILDDDAVGNILNELDKKVNVSDKADLQTAIAGTDDTKWMSAKMVKDARYRQINSGDVVVSINEPTDGTYINLGVPFFLPDVLPKYGWYGAYKSRWADSTMYAYKGTVMTGYYDGVIHGGMAGILDGSTNRAMFATTSGARNSYTILWNDQTMRGVSLKTDPRNNGLETTINTIGNTGDIMYYETSGYFKANSRNLTNSIIEFAKNGVQIHTFNNRTGPARLIGYFITGNDLHLVISCESGYGLQHTILQGGANSDVLLDGAAYETVINWRNSNDSIAPLRPRNNQSHPWSLVKKLSNDARFLAVRYGVSEKTYYVSLVKIPFDNSPITVTNLHRVNSLNSYNLDRAWIVEAESIDGPNIIYYMYADTGTYLWLVKYDLETETSLSSRRICNKVNYAGTFGPSVIAYQRPDGLIEMSLSFYDTDKLAAASLTSAFGAPEKKLDNFVTPDKVKACVLSTTGSFQPIASSFPDVCDICVIQNPSEYNSPSLSVNSTEYCMGGWYVTSDKKYLLFITSTGLWIRDLSIPVNSSLYKNATRLGYKFTEESFWANGTYDTLYQRYSALFAEDLRYGDVYIFTGSKGSDANIVYNRGVFKFNRSYLDITECPAASLMWMRK